MADETVNIIFKATDAASGVLQGLLGRFGGIATAAGAATLAIDTLSRFVKDSVRAAAEAETEMARLNATLTATGRGMEISSRQIDKMATSLMKMSTFDDEAIISAFNTLSKFQSIPTKNMEGLVKTAMDMSAAMGGDLKANAEMLGRALETGLIPRTWAFSAALKAQFTEQVKAGNSAAALTTLMDELNKRYGGQAAAQLNTYTGSVEALGNEWETFLENVGDPALLGGKGWNNWWQELVGSFNLMFEVSQKLPPELSATSAQIRYLTRDLGDFSSELEISTEHFDGTREVFDGLASSLGMMDPKVQAVGLAFGYLDEQAINMMVAMKNFDAALDAWGSKPITKKIVIDMWFNAMGGLAVQRGMEDRGTYLQAQAERIQAGT